MNSRPQSASERLNATCSAAKNTRPRIFSFCTTRVKTTPTYFPSSTPRNTPYLRQLASDPSYPIEGGSANDYDYVDGDPVNGRDLAGTNGSSFDWGAGFYAGFFIYGNKLGINDDHAYYWNYSSKSVRVQARLWIDGKLDHEETPVSVPRMTKNEVWYADAYFDPGYLTLHVHNNSEVCVDWAEPYNPKTRKQKALTKKMCVRIHR